jgi:DNA-binding CsgD family transcriptional regulator
MTPRADKSPKDAPSRTYKGRPLTPRESEVFRLMAAGLTNDSIAAELGFGVDAAKIHARHIFDKLSAISRTHAVSIGLTTGLLDREDIGSLIETFGTKALAENTLDEGDE